MGDGVISVFLIDLLPRMRIILRPKNSFVADTQHDEMCLETLSSYITSRSKMLTNGGASRSPYYKLGHLAYLHKILLAHPRSSFLNCRTAQCPCTIIVASIKVSIDAPTPIPTAYESGGGRPIPILTILDPPSPSRDPEDSPERTPPAVTMSPPRRGGDSPERTGGIDDVFSTTMGFFSIEGADAGKVSMTESEVSARFHQVYERWHERNMTSRRAMTYLWQHVELRSYPPTIVATQPQHVLMFDSSVDYISSTVRLLISNTKRCLPLVPCLFHLLPQSVLR